MRHVREPSRALLAGHHRGVSCGTRHAGYPASAMTSSGGGTHPDGSGASPQELVLRGGVWNAAATLSSLALGFPITVVLVRVMSPSSYGALSLGVAMAGIVGALAGLGLAPGVARLGSFALSSEGTRGLGAVVAAGRRISIWAAVGALVVSAGVIAAVSFVPNARPAAPVFLILMPTVALIPWQGVSLGYRMALHQARRAETSRMLAAVVLLVLSLALVLVGRRSAVELAAPRLIAAVVGLVAIAWGVGRAGRGGGKRYTRELMLSSLPLVLSGVMWIVIAQLDVVVLGGVKGTAAAGLYAPVTRLVDWGITFFGFAGAYLLPALTAAATVGDAGAERRLFHSISRWGIVIASPFVGVIVATPSEALQVLYGRGYGTLGDVARILSIGMLVHVGFGFNAASLQAHGYSGLVGRSAALGLLVDLAFCVALIPRFGVYGAAWATTAALAAVNASNSLYQLRRCRLRPWDRGLASTVAALMLGVAVAWMLAPALPDGFVRCVLAAALAGGAGLGASLAVSTPEEREWLSALFRRRTR